MRVYPQSYTLVRFTHLSGALCFLSRRQEIIKLNAVRSWGEKLMSVILDVCLCRVSTCCPLCPADMVIHTTKLFIPLKQVPRSDVKEHLGRIGWFAVRVLHRCSFWHFFEQGIQEYDWG